MSLLCYVCHCVGYAAGLHRPVMLVVGNLSFLHDVNGLSHQPFSFAAAWCCVRYAAEQHRPVTLAVHYLSFLQADTCLCCHACIVCCFAGYTAGLHRPVTLVVGDVSPCNLTHCCAACIHAAL
jgi:hypothetical protein